MLFRHVPEWLVASVPVNNDTIEIICKAKESHAEEHIKMKPFSRRRLSFAILCSAASACLCLPAWSQPKVAYLHLTQAHHVLGPLDVYASNRLSVLRLKKMDCTIYIDARQKDPNVTLVNSTRKSYFQTPLSKFEYSLVTTLDTISDLDWEPKFWKFFGKTTICGFTADEYRYRGTVGMYERKQMPYLPGKRGETTVKSQVICLQTPQVTKALCDLLKKMEHLPVLGGIPLMMETTYTIGRPRNQLATIKIALEQLDEMKLPDLTKHTKVSRSSEIFYSKVNVFDLLGD